MTGRVKKATPQPPPGVREAAAVLTPPQIVITVGPMGAQLASPLPPLLTIKVLADLIGAIVAREAAPTTPSSGLIVPRPVVPTDLTS